MARLASQAKAGFFPTPESVVSLLKTKISFEKDARAFIVILTEKAEQLMPDILCIQEKWMNELTEEMTENERSAFCGLMQKAVDKATLMCKDD